MRPVILGFVITCFSGSLASGQGPAEASLDRVYPAHAETARDLQELVGVIRTMTDIQQASADTAGRAVTLRGTAGQIALAEWLMGEVDVPRSQPVVAQQSQRPAPHEYRVMDGGDEDLVHAFHLAHAPTDQDLTEIATSIRTLTDVRKLFMCNAARAIVARGTAGQIRTAEWLVNELDKPADRQPQTREDRLSSTHEYRLSGVTDEVVRAFYLRNTASPRDLTEVTTTMRTIADIRRAFQITNRRAMVLRGTAGQIALTEWLMTELDNDATAPSRAQPPQWAPPQEYRIPGDADDMVRVFHLTRAATDADLAAIATQIRVTARITKLFHCNAPKAIAARGTSAQIALAGELIKEREER